MIRPPNHLRYLWPVVLSALVSFALCATVAVFLFREQASSASALGDHLAAHRAVAVLEETVDALLSALVTHPERVPDLNSRISEQLTTVRGYAHNPDEVDMVNRVASGFEHYLAAWRTGTGSSSPTARRAAGAILEAEVMRPSQELREAEARRIVEAELEHQATLRQLAWGLGAIGGLAGLAGLLLGFGVARGLTRSIQRIQVRVQDAAGMLGRELPAVELVGGGTLDQLDRQVQALVGKVSIVVETLQQREREVRRADQLAAVGQLAAGMAHEIRNPMTSIQMLVQDAQERPDRGLSAEDLAVIEREVRRIERTLQTFLDYARPPRPSKAPTDLRSVVHETLDLTRGRAAKQRIHVRVDGPDQPLIVDADPGQLRQVLVNLLLNALDAMPGGGNLNVELSADGPVAIVRVSDTGPGVAAGVRLFEPFASTKDTGLGLGLVISRRIVEDHCGTIAAERSSGGGARFTVRLPIA